MIFVSGNIRVSFPPKLAMGHGRGVEVKEKRVTHFS
jgi:hypothetical protein